MRGYQDESTPLCPVSPYAAAKAFSFWITSSARITHGLFAVNGILFNHESPRRGWRPPGTRFEIIRLTRYLDRSWLRDPKNHLCCSSDPSGFEKLCYARGSERAARLGPCPGLYARCLQHDEARCARRLCSSDWRDTIGQRLCGDSISDRRDSAEVSVSDAKQKKKLEANRTDKAGVGVELTRLVSMLVMDRFEFV